MNNFEHLFGYVYKVENQNGFNNALYHAFADDGYSKAELREAAQDYPKKYPCMVEFLDQMLDCRRIFAFFDNVDEPQLAEVQKPTQRYCYSWDNKCFNSGTFDSIDDALSDALKARNENDLQSPQQFVYIADAKGFDNRTFYPDADTIIEHMACNADDVGGEHADGYPDADATAEAELTQKLHELLDQWCAKHQISPTFYHAGKGVKYELNQVSNQ